jgi:lipid II:glycine glycyltransferase (peptidoglycan interpeptide bridge formation enzyme)
VPALDVRPITAAEHLAYVASRPSVSFLQTPAWGRAKADWRPESLGWFDASGAIRGAGLVLFRSIPRLRRSLAYLPEGPDLPWEDAAADGSLGEWLTPLRRHLAGAGAFAIRMGPTVVTRRWSAATLKDGLANPGVVRFADLPPDEEHRPGLAVGQALAGLGWQPPSAADGFSAGQPRHVFWLPLDGRDEDAVFAGFNQLWRRNVRKAEKLGVQVRSGDATDLAAFHELYVETAARDGFTPRPRSYFDTMWAALTAEDPDRLRLYLAEHEGDLVAATTMTRVGQHAWYSYGASSSEKREVRGSNAIQWRMMRDALAAGATVYDLRGITDTLAEDDPHVGLLQFKVGTGGQAVEYLGEWTLPVHQLLHRAFERYLARRG